MHELEAKKKVKALIELVTSIGRPVIRKPAHETRAHRRWRLSASVVRRIHLYSAALPLECSSMIQAYFDANAQARRARIAMTREKRPKSRPY
jgi:hypothetical protein